MKLIEHLEMVIGLVERSASQAEIKGALLGMHEEVAGAQCTADEKLALIEENSALRNAKSAVDTKLEKLQFEASHPPRTKKGTLILRPKEQERLEELMDEKMKAGLSREQAEDVARRQIEQDRGKMPA
jgi:hypothetical protein